MKYIELEWDDIRKNIQRNRGGIFIIFAVFFFAGILWGYIEMKSYRQEIYTAEDTIVQKVDLEHLERDESYYYSAFMELKEKSCGLNAYIQYLKQVNLRANSLTKVLELEALSLEEQKILRKMQEFYISEKPIICNDIDRTQSFVQTKLEAGRNKVERAEQTVLETEKSFTRDFSKEEQEKALGLKLYAQEEVRIWESYLKKIENLDLNKSQETNVYMDQLLEEGMESINNLVEKFNDLIISIEAEEQYEIIYNPYLLSEYSNMVGIVGELYEKDVVNEKKNEALIYARSIAGVDSREERFYAVFTFSILLGTAFSLLYGTLRNRESC